MASLELLLLREDSVYWPTHGPSIENPRRHVRAFITHRKMREAQIVECLRNGLVTIPAMVDSMYRNVPDGLHRAATRSVFAHVIHMVDTGRLATDPPGTVQPTGTLAAGQDFYVRTYGSGRNRWGDYSGISLDPADDVTFWVFNEYAMPRGTPTNPPPEDGRWATEWGSFIMGCQPVAVAITGFEARVLSPWR